jgi:hypothetical protein
MTASTAPPHPPTASPSCRRRLPPHAIKHNPPFKRRRRRRGSPLPVSPSPPSPSRRHIDPQLPLAIVPICSSSPSLRFVPLPRHHAALCRHLAGGMWARRLGSIVSWWAYCGPIRMAQVSDLFIFVFLQILHGYVLMEYPVRIHIGYISER